MGQQKISACLVIHNEERLIRRCLESLNGVVDEIVVVHDGPCTDRSLEICKEYTDKIFVRPYIGNCDPHRVFAFEQASGDWILIIDADEFLSEGLRANLRSLVERGNADLYAFIWPYPDGGIPVTERLRHPYRACLARKSRLFFYGIIHEPLRTYGRIQKIPLVLYHLPNYDPFSIQNFRRKVIPWAKRTAEWIWKEPSEIPCYGLRNNEMLQTHLDKLRSHAFVKIPWRFVRHLAWHLWKGMWKLGIRGLKIALLDAFNVACQQYYIWRMNPKRRS